MFVLACRQRIRQLHNPPSARRTRISVHAPHLTFFSAIAETTNSRSCIFFPFFSDLNSQVGVQWTGVRFATIESTGPRRRNEEAGCRRGGETASRGSWWPGAWRWWRRFAVVAVAAPA